MKKLGMSRRGHSSANNAMPSPSPIPRSSSYPNISSAAGAGANTYIPASSSSNRSAKFSYWPHWSNINQLGKLIIPAGRSSTSEHSDLTEESLEAHNRRHAPIINNNRISNVNNVDERNAKCSPYYKGLTDASLVINRERHTSPGRESHATSTSSSISTFMVKMQELSSCFTFKSSINAVKKSSIHLSASSSTAATHVKEMNLEKEDVDVDDHKEKPLRERVLESSSSSTTWQLKSGLQNEKQREREFVFAKKYQPKALIDFICNRDKATQLHDLVKEGGCRNFIFEGPPGSGKRTMIRAMLRETFGPDKVQTRDECKAFNLKGEMIASIQVNVKESSEHVELNLSDLKGYEKHIIVEFMKETQSKIFKKDLPSKPDNSRAIVLCEADKLSTDALLYIRWLLERYKGLNRVFFCCCDLSKLQPIKSLCTVVQLFPPSKQEIIQVLEFIAKQEGIDLPHKLAAKFADNSKNNLRQAIRSFEASWHMSYPFEEDQVVLTGWEDDITNIAKKIIEEQSPKQLYIIRGKLQSLIEHDVSLDFIFKSLVEELKKHLDLGLHRQIDNLYDEYTRDDGGMFDNEKPFVFGRNRHEETGKRFNDPMRKNVHHFLRIEEFIAKFMSWYKTNVTNNKLEYHEGIP